jgi:apolipoprotein D and lipocalin family protein
MTVTAAMAAFRFFVFAIWAALLPVSALADQPVKSISELDISRYMGSWYEIAKLPNWFQRRCIQGTQA